MPAIQEVDPLRLEGLVAEYGVGELIRHWPASAGIENSNYFLSTLSSIETVFLIWMNCYCLICR